MAELDEFTPPVRKSKEIPLAEAGRLIAARKVVSLAGSQTVNTPMALIREALRAGARGLTVIPPVSAGIGPDLMIAAGRVAAFYVCYIGFEQLGFAPAFRRAAESKSIEVIEADEPFIMLGTRAAAGGMPFVPIERVYEGTDLPRLNPKLRKVTDPFTGEEIMAIPPLKADVCIIHAQECDPYGNAQCWGGNLQEPDKAMAADFVIVSAERIVSVDRTRDNVRRVTLPGHMVDAVVHVPFGAHPTVSPNQYRADLDHLKLYCDLVGAGRGEEYLSRFVFDPKDHADYLARVGLGNVLGLAREV
jgi:glutaconate CoA-transferase subunit A